jgi:hypothetical protein
MRALSRLAAVAVLLVGAVTLHAEDKTASTGELATRSAKLADDIEAVYRQALVLKEKAKKQNDVIKLNCVNDKLVELKAQMNLGDTAKQNLDAALASDDAIAAPSLMVEYQVIADATKLLLEDAKACIHAISESPRRAQCGDTL